MTELPSTALARADKPVRAILVSHTHWDRAWYVPFQVYRIRLVRLIDRLLDILDRDPEYRCFMLDGQVLPVEDYLEIRPERRADLERLVRAGRLSIGPWYVLADEYLVSPEALIRNLMIGLRLAAEFGGAMCEGYAPDAFGHIGQLPQILRGFGIDSAIFWRGLGDEGEGLGSEFWWEAPDGSRVLVIYLSEGYGNVANLGYTLGWGDSSAMEFDLDRALARLRKVIDLLRSRAHGNMVLLMNGTDHVEADPHVPAAIARANQVFDDVAIVHGKLSEHVAAVRTSLDGKLPVFQGEMNRSRYAFGLQGVYSSRMYLNQVNERVQTLLECYAEPLSAWAWTLGTAYPGPFLDLAWRKLLQNHPHDDVCGCSDDAVHRENMVRYGEVEQIGQALARDACRAIMQRIDRTGQSGVPFVFFNPAAWSRTGTAEVELQFERGDATAGDFHLVDAAGRTVPHQCLNHSRRFETEVGRSNDLQTVRLALPLAALPACGYRVYYACPGPAAELSPVGQPVEVFANGMENRHLRVEIEPDGTLAVLDKSTGRRFHDLGYFLDEEDVGDEYDYSPCPEPERISTLGEPAAVRLLSAGALQVTYEIVHDLAIPASIAAGRQRRGSERVRYPIRTTVTLRHDSRRVDLHTTVDNRASDHRLRACFRTDIQTDVAHADGHFDVLSRPIDLPSGEGWHQPPVPTRHQRYFVDLSDGQAGLAILNRGLAEYEVLRDGGSNTIAITLLRCVGYLSRGDGDMTTRPGLAGPPLPTPEAQCPGLHTFEYAIVPHAGDWRYVYREAYTFRAPVCVRRGTEHEGYTPTQAEIETWGAAGLRALDLSGDLPGELSFLALEPEVLALSAVKRSEDGDGLIVRFYNPAKEPIEATLRTFNPILSAQEVNLNEEGLAGLEVVEGYAITLAVGGRQVKTVALRVAATAL
jgi:mannosylglycerate hydrolase